MQIDGSWERLLAARALHLNHRISFRAVGREQPAIDRSGIDQNNALMAFHRRARRVANHNPAIATVVGLPERLADGQIRFTGTVEPGMGRAPTVSAVQQRQLVEAMRPLSVQGWL